MLPLFRFYPRLQEKLPYIALGDFPTSVTRAEQLGREIGIPELYIKRDDLSGQTYGGNKIRKLEFLLGQARQAGAKRVVTFGYAGSNHALATSIYARELGMGSISLLLSQPNARYVGHNLLQGAASGADLYHYPHIPALAAGMARIFLRYGRQDGRLPWIIPPGGSSPLGTVGYVNAAFELRDQIQAGQLPEPDLIYVALGTMGTAVGLALGMAAAGLKTRVVPVRVVGDGVADEAKYRRLYRRTQALLHRADPSFPSGNLTGESGMVGEFFGEQYALFTPAGIEAVHRMGRAEGIRLEGTYTGKTMAALLARAASLGDKCVLFWNTYNGRDWAPTTADADYHRLPPLFHSYFTAARQPLDRDPVP